MKNKKDEFHVVMRKDERHNVQLEINKKYNEKIAGGRQLLQSE